MALRGVYYTSIIVDNPVWYLIFDINPIYSSNKHLRQDLNMYLKAWGHWMWWWMMITHNSNTFLFIYLAPHNKLNWTHSAMQLPESVCVWCCVYEWDHAVSTSPAPAAAVLPDWPGWPPVLSHGKNCNRCNKTTMKRSTLHFGMSCSLGSQS